MNFFKKNKKKILAGVIIVIFITIGFLYFNREKKIEYNFTIAEKQDLIQEISATGRVKAVNEVDLAFEKSGRISEIFVKVGDQVKEGQILTTLESEDILAELAQAESGVISAEARLKQYEAVLEKEKSELETLEIGTREEEIAIYQSKVINAEAIYNASIQNVIDTLNDSYTKSDNAIRNQIDPLFRDLNTDNPQIIFSVNDAQLEVDIETGRSLIEQQLETWVSSLGIINKENLESQIKLAENSLNVLKAFLENMALAINNLTVNSSFSQTTIDGYKSDIYTSRTNIGLAITNLSTAKEKLNTAYTSLLVAKNELTLKQASNTPEKINSQKAVIKQAEANIASQEAEINFKKSIVQASLAKLSKNTLKSPIAGIIIKQDAKIGSIVSGSEIIISVISENNFQIESYIVEADIAYLKIGDQAKLTLDAYGEDVFFKAEVIKIDPAAQLIEGVANYKTTLKFIERDERIKAGMTADLDIITMEIKNVLVVPYRAIIFRNGSGKFVRILSENNQIIEKKVEIGVIGNGSLVEITEGLNEGDKAITSIKNN
ncbi:efflux RND transporter periplasmic adaptor subunit [Patescibacteria group bacterium]|nr:efflux RND transporter periplasmic adaptor subunit [Patescibacteria group bacterium]